MGVSAALLVVPKLTDRHLLKQREKSAEVVGVGMGHHDVIEPMDALMP